LKIVKICDFVTSLQKCCRHVKISAVLYLPAQKSYARWRDISLFWSIIWMLHGSNKAKNSGTYCYPINFKFSKIISNL